MSGFQTDDGRLAPTRLGLALQELEAGTLDPVSRDELMALVTHSPASQRAYLEYFETSALLEAEAATHVEQGMLPQVPDFGQQARLFRRSLMAAAALVLIGALVAGLIHVARPQAPELALAAAAETRWAIEGKARDLKDRSASVREGATVRVESGTLELRMESGAAMVVQGPARISFPKLTKPFVHSGCLWIDSGPAGESFEVHTPGLRIRNLGTRFGVRAPADGPAEVHLIHGKLEVRGKPGERDPLRFSADGRGIAIPQLGEPTLLDLMRDPFPDITELMAAPANYPTTVRGQNPAGHWRLDTEADGRLPNEVEGETSGRLLAGASIDGHAPGPAEGFQGFSAGNRACLVSGKSPRAGVSLGSSPRQEGLLFRHRFEGTGPLDLKKPDVAKPEAEWVAGPQFHADGTITGGHGRATLAFRPTDGVVYTLQAELHDLVTPPGSDDWVALGFASGQSASSGTSARFIEQTVIGRAWMLFRGQAANSENTTHLNGISAPDNWRDWTSGAGGDIDLRIVLDTSGGPGNWAATWFARRPGEKDFIQVRGRARLPNEAIDSFGIAVTGDETRARIAGISLQGEAATVNAPTTPAADGPSPLSRQAGALSCWLRWSPENSGPQILWSAGGNPADDSIHVRIEADGRVGFFIENGRFDMLLTTETSLAEDRWHHLAATWSPHTAALFLDGKRVAGQREFLGLPQGGLADFRVGCGPRNAKVAGFAGWIDEIAIWTRALAPIEIEQQYRSALGKESQPR